MVRLLTFCVLAIIAGLGVGFGFARQNLKGPNMFGPFGEGSSVTPDNLDEYLNKSADKRKGTPRAEVVGSKTFDFGTGTRGGKGEHNFVVKNTGDAPLELKVLSATCKCTVGNLEKNILDPGEQTSVNLSWEIKTDSSVFSQSATIRTTDPDLLELSFTITGTVVDAALFEPGQWNVSQIQPQSEEELVSTIYIYKTEPFKVIEAGWTREQIAAFSEHSFTERKIDPDKDAKFAKADRAIELKVKLLPGLRQGPLSEIFRVRYFVGAGDPPPVEECPVADLSLNGTVVGDVSIIGGPSLEINNQMFLYNLGKTPAGKELKAKAFVNIRGESAGEEQPKITKVYPENSLQAELGSAVKRQNSVLFPLTFGVKADATPIELSGRDRNDYGWIEIGFDNTKRAPVKLFLQFTVTEPE